jgi:hypothetical protein
MFEIETCAHLATPPLELQWGKTMKTTFLALIAAAFVVSQAGAAPGTWTGTISDSGCGGSHEAMTDHGKKGTDKTCTEMCIMKGAKYVFVNEGKALMIKNQNLADLKKFAGDRVTVSGDLSGDTITITKIAAAK